MTGMGMGVHSWSALSKASTRDAPLTFLRGHRGQQQADAYPRYDPLCLTGKITDVG